MLPKIHTGRFRQKPECHLRRGSVLLLLLIKHFFSPLLDADESAWHFTFWRPVLYTPTG